MQAAVYDPNVVVLNTRRANAWGGVVEQVFSDWSKDFIRSSAKGKRSRLGDNRVLTPGNRVRFQASAVG